MSFERFTLDPGGWGDSAAAQAPPSIVDRDPRIHDVFNDIEFMEQHRRPAALSEVRWHELLRDMRHVAEKWLDIAFACGWEVPDLFGSPPTLGGRVGLMGVAVLLRGRTIESIDQDRVVIANQLGGPSVFRRAYPGSCRNGQEMIWNVITKAEEA